MTLGDDREVSWGVREWSALISVTVLLFASVAGFARSTDSQMAAQRERITAVESRVKDVKDDMTSIRDDIAEIRQDIKQLLQQKGTR